MLKKEDIKVTVINKPNKEESGKRIKALCDLLGKIWKLNKKAKN